MKLKSVLAYVWKLPLCGLVYLVAMVLSGIILPLLGLPLPEMPAGAEQGPVLLWSLLGGVVLALMLSFVSRNMALGWLARWAALFALAWVVGGIGMTVEAVFFMTTGAVSSAGSALFTVLSQGLTSLFLTALVAALFRPAPPAAPRLGAFFAARRPSEWAWRVGLAMLAFPLTYFTFGLLVRPLTQDYYLSGQYELVNPTWGQLIPLQLGRSLLFLLACLAILVWWRGPRHRLWLALGLSIFVLTGVQTMAAYWFPWQLRLFHGLELLADALVYTGVLIPLLRQGQETLAGQPA